MATATVVLDGKAYTLSVPAPLSSLPLGEQPCGGHGRCGKCKVIATGALSALTQGERELLTADEIARGVRLSCKTTVLGDCSVQTLSQKQDPSILTSGRKLTLPSLSPRFCRYGVAIDLGTTTLAARLYDASGHPLATAARLNPQLRFGADVLSRIEAAMSGKAEQLTQSVRRALDELLCELSARAGLSPTDVDALTVTGNTAMLYLLAGCSVKPLSHAPFAIDQHLHQSFSARSLGLHSLSPQVPVYLPYCISAFVGADVCCAILAADLCSHSDTAMLVDIGTNGEMALWNGQTLTVASCAAGPAFEGVGISMGMRGDTGAIDRVCIVNGRLEPHVIGAAPPKGICGGGLVDAIACLLDLGLLDELGCLEDGRVLLLPPVSLTQNDIHAVQLAKSAIHAGLLTLLDAHALCPSDVQALYVAGGFGNHLHIKNAERIGLLPQGVAAVTHPIGNAALDGAAMLLLCKELDEELVDQAKSAHVLSLATSKTFCELYISGMTFKPME